MPIADLVDSLGTNPYFSAGFGLVGVGAGIAYLRRGYEIGKILFKRHCLISMELVSKDKSYEWVLQWITNHSRHSQHLSVKTTIDQPESGKVFTSFSFMPSVGVHFINYKKKWIKVERSREQQMLDLYSGTPFETVKFTCFGKDKQVYLDILEEARNEALKENEGKTVMYTGTTSEWRQLGNPRKPRPMKSVILDQQKAENILEDINEFLNSSKWYSDRGVPYRRGYLLYGPPGCGKTSYITALAGELNYSICVLNLADRSLSDDRLQHLMLQVPAQSIILLEDIDAVFLSREESTEMRSAYDGLNTVTFSGLLNMLDGVASTEARILFMTTNYIERLDPALIRPGRVDMKEYIGFASDDQLKRAFIKFYPHTDSQMADEFAKVIASYKQSVSMAQIQGYFLFFKDNPLSALKNVNMLFGYECK